jgi:hypothetical protein
LNIPIDSITYKINSLNEENERNISILRVNHGYIIKLEEELYNILRKNTNLKLNENGIENRRGK